MDDLCWLLQLQRLSQIRPPPSVVLFVFLAELVLLRQESSINYILHVYHCTLQSWTNSKSLLTFINELRPTYLWPMCQQTSRLLNKVPPLNAGPTRSETSDPNFLPDLSSANICHLSKSRIQSCKCSTVLKQDTKKQNDNFMYLHCFTGMTSLKPMTIGVMSWIEAEKTPYFSKYWSFLL